MKKKLKRLLIPLIPFLNTRILLYCTASITIIISITYLSYSIASSNQTTSTLSPLPVASQATQVNEATETKEDALSKIEESEITPATKSVCLDPGHGGDDPGAMKGKITERDINLITANKVRALLESKGYIVYMTRTANDVGLSKHDRYSFCNSHDASVLVAVHHNTYSSSKVNYTTALYYTEHDQPLAESIARSVSNALKLENKGIAWFDNSVLSKSTMPAVFSEAFFMTNSSEYSKLVGKNYSRLDKEAAGIVEGILNYFDNPTQFKPSYTSEELKIDRADW